jgi:hypothetical protein
MSKFDPDKYLQGKPQAQPEPEPKSFNPDAYLAGTPAPSQPFDPDAYLAAEGTAIQSELENRSFFDRPLLRAQEVTDNEINEIAQRYGVDSAKLRQIAPLFGANTTGNSPADLAKESAGFLGDVLLSVPQKLYKVAQDDKMEKALDELQNLASARKSYLGFAGEVAAPVGIGGRAVSTLGKLAEGAAIGSVAGAAGAQQGKELEGGLLGAGLGGALGGVSAAIGRKSSNEIDQVASRSTRPIDQEEASKLLEDIAQSRGAKGQFDIDEEATKLLKSREQADDIINRLAVGSTEVVPIDEVTRRTILEDLLPGDKLAAAYDTIGSDEGRILQSILDQRKVELASELAGKSISKVDEAAEVIAEYELRQGGRQAIEDVQKVLDRERARNDYIDINDLRTEPPANPYVDRAINFLSDAQFVLRSTAEKFGIPVDAIHNRMNSNKNKYLHVMNEFQQRVNSVFKDAKKLGVDEDVVEGRKIINAIEEGNLDSLTEPQRKLASQVQEFFEDARQAVNNPEKFPGVTPLSIPKLENYVRRQMVDPMEAVSRIRKLSTQALDEVSAVLGKPVTSLRQLDNISYNRALQSSPTLVDLQDILKFVTPEDVTFKNGRQIYNALSEVAHSREGYSKLQSSASAAMAREGEIPELLRETNLFKLMDSWSRGTVRHLFMRDDIRQMASAARSIRNLGGDLEADYIDNLLRDLTGTRSGTPSAVLRSMTQSTYDALNQAIEKYGNDSYKGKIAGFVKAVPGLLDATQRQIYPNMLGLSPRALVMNMTQPFVKSAPELGGAYGVETTAKSVMSTYGSFSTGKSEQLIKRLNELGLAPPDFVKQMQEATAEGVLRSGVARAAGSTIETISNVSMYMYQKMDLINRSVVVDMSERMISDMVTGSPRARAALAKAPTSVQRDILTALASGNSDEAVSVLAKHLNAATQYNYNRESMSEFGRVMGPMFSTFSKWPTATLGEIAGEIKDKGFTRGTIRSAEKYLAPLAALTAAGYVLHGSREDMSDRQKKLFGASGLAQASPLGAIPSFLSGEFFTPPAIDIVWAGVINPAIKGDSDKLENGIAQAVGTFAPGAGLIRFLTDDLITYITGERPEGNFFDKSIEGAKQLKKELK